MVGGGMAVFVSVGGRITLLAVGCLLSSNAPSAYGQGTVNFANRVLGKVIAPVYGLERCPCSSVPLTGNSDIGYPVGCRVYTGPLVAGMGYTAALYAGLLGTSAEQLVFIAATGFRDGTGAGFFVSRTLNVPGIAAGQRATFQVRAWDNRGGSITTWQQVLADNTLPRGTSELFSPEDPLGGLANGQNHDVLNLEGLTSFNLIVPSAGTTCEPLCQPADVTVVRGQTAELCFELCGASCNYQWYFNGGVIPHATNSTLILSNIQAEQAGLYFAIVDFSRISPAATVSVLVDATVVWNPRWLFGQLFQFDLTGPAGRVYVIETSRDLVNWNTLATVTNTTGSMTVEEFWSGQDRRFYRAREK